VLVITRKKDQSIIVRPKKAVTLTPDDIIEFTVCEIARGNRCKVGISAPASLRIDRSDRPIVKRKGELESEIVAAENS